MFWKLHEIPRDSMVFHELPQNLSQSSMGFHGVPFRIYPKVPWLLLKFHRESCEIGPKVPWLSIIFHSLPKGSMRFLGMHWRLWRYSGASEEALSSWKCPRNDCMSAGRSCCLLHISGYVLWLVCPWFGWLRVVWGQTYLGGARGSWGWSHMSTWGLICRHMSLLAILSYLQINRYTALVSDSMK